jgi:hypothetical protein
MCGIDWTGVSNCKNKKVNKRFVVFFPRAFSVHLIYFNMFPWCEQDNESTGTMEAEVITGLHSVTKTNTSDKSDREEKKDDQIGISKF